MTCAAAAGAFMMPEGQGQLIAGVGYVESSRRFDQTGTAVPTMRYTKASASGYLEYGLTAGVTLLLAPTLSRANAVAANSVTGSDSSAFGARLALYGTRTSIVAVQVLVQPPLGNSDSASAPADGGTRSLAADLRVMLGQAFVVAGLPAFVDIQPGARLRTDPFPTEARLDLTFGVRPSQHVLLLVQTFSVWAPPSGALLRTSYTKAQTTIVYDLSSHWAVQVGGFRTIAGRDAIRETGPLAAVWYRF